MALVVVSPGGAASYAAANGGKVRAFNTITHTANTLVAAANPSRQRIVFHNPGTVDIFISPTVAVNASGSNVVLTPTTSALGGTFRVYGNGGTLTLEGECQCEWQALALSGGPVNPLTVMDSNV